MIDFSRQRVIPRSREQKMLMSAVVHSENAEKARRHEKQKEKSGTLMTNDDEKNEKIR